jgi:hypothetical protein
MCQPANGIQRTISGELRGLGTIESYVCGKGRTEMAKEEHDYIANCIANAMGECAPSQQYRLAKDIAEAVRIADRENRNAAHQYLVGVANQAMAGAYNGRPKSSD